MKMMAFVNAYENPESEEAQRIFQAAWQDEIEFKCKSLVKLWREARSKYPEVTVDQFGKGYLETMVDRREYNGDEDQQTMSKAINRCLTFIALENLKEVLMQEAGLG